MKDATTLTDDDLSEITIIDPNLNRRFKDDKLSILDVRARTKTGNQINIEIQVEKKENFEPRVLYYASRLVSDQIGKGEDYLGIQKTISIVIIDYIFFHETNSYKNIFKYYDKDNNQLLTDKSEIHIFELPKISHNKVDDKLEQWLQFIKIETREDLMDIAERYPHLKVAAAEVEKLSHDPDQRLLYEARLKQLWDLRAEYQYAHNSGLRDGKELGIQQGLQAGRELGIQQGIQQGIHEKALETAKNAQKIGLSKDQIIELTGLSKEEIDNL